MFLEGERASDDTDEMIVLFSRLKNKLTVYKEVIIFQTFSFRLNIQMQNRAKIISLIVLKIVNSFYKEVKIN